MNENVGSCTVKTVLADDRVIEVTVSTTGEVVIDIYSDEGEYEAGRPNESIVTDVDGLVEAFAD